MRREERQLVRYRAMFRHYPDALTPSQVQEMLGIGRRNDLRSAPKRPDSQCPHGAALPDPQGGGNRLPVRNRRKDLKKSSAQGNITRPWTDVLYCERRNL